MEFFELTISTIASLREEIVEYLNLNKIARILKKRKCLKHIEKIESIIDKYESSINIIPYDQVNEYLNYIAHITMLDNSLYPIQHCIRCVVDQDNSIRAYFKYNLGKAEANVIVSSNYTIRYTYINERGQITMNHTVDNVHEIPSLETPKVEAKYTEQFMTVATTFGKILKDDMIEELRKNINDLKSLLNG